MVLSATFASRNVSGHMVLFLSFVQLSQQVVLKFWAVVYQLGRDFLWDPDVGRVAVCQNNYV
jgi:hypothetical protein